MKNPGRDHPIAIKPADGRWRVSFDQHVIADSGDAMILQEAHLRPVVYFPRQDVNMEYFSRTDRSTHCPYKGDASYYSLLMDGDLVENIAWSYEEPYPAMEEIRGRIAFYPDQVKIYEVEDAKVNPHHLEGGSVDDVVLHTDSGSGASQREHWPANVSRPPEL
ncbi:MAG: DUF427 domain-containing protein [Phenylobacterium sp.]|uniref:DUF427 domain-containing protein n=1 Tax=Phenylobacterium sp. TaxID=1871053 RepID=UPI00391B5BCA